MFLGLSKLASTPRHLSSQKMKVVQNVLGEQHVIRDHRMQRLEKTSSEPFGHFAKHACCVQYR